MSLISIAQKAQDLGFNVDLLEESVKESFRHALAGVAQAAHAEWIALAQSRLKTSRDDYVMGLQKANSFEVGRDPDGEKNYTITLRGQLANNVETGMPPFDMKNVRPGWLGGTKAKTSKDGSKYVTIPFRHSTSNSPRAAYSGKAAVDNLKKELKKTVRDYGLDRMVRTATGAIKQGSVKRVPRDEGVHRYLHGLTRIQSRARGLTPRGLQRGQSQLMTWRIMSEKSAPDSWLHPGITAKNLLRDVESWTDRQMTNIVKTVLE
jgi:hypothetical protein